MHSLLALGFGLGLLHALDADHIMAVSALASGDGRGGSRTVAKTVRFCASWAIGHAGVLLSLSALLVYAGVQPPGIVHELAEKLVGLLLIGLGGWILWNVWRHRWRIEVHRHDDVTHAHLVLDGETKHDHRPLLVGLVHGLAGSAPILALIPALDVTNAWFAVGYAAVFSVGVLTAMLVFGVFFGRIRNWLARVGGRVFDASRVVIAGLSVVFGGYWLFYGH